MKRQLKVVDRNFINFHRRQQPCNLYCLWACWESEEFAPCPHQVHLSGPVGLLLFQGRHHRGIKYEGEDEDVTEGGACSTPTPSWSCQLKSGVSAPVTSLHGVEGGEIGSVHVAG